MADYYPLLAKAVAGLPQSTPDARRSIYDRARNALYGQLRSLEPPVPETVIEREAHALEEAVARLEVELSLDMPAIGEALSEASASVPMAAAQPPAEPADVSSLPVEPTGIRPEAPGPATAPAVSAGPETDTTFPQVEGAQVEAAQVESPQVESPQVEAAGLSSVAAAPAESRAASGRKEVRRPSVPMPERRAAVPKRRWIVAAAVGLVVGLVAALAYALRDRPEDVMRPPVAAQPATADEAAGGKIVDRIGSGEAKPVEPPPVVPVVKHEERPSLSLAEPPAAVARRAALLVEAPEEQSKVKVRLGTVIWRIENINNGPGEPLGMAVRAEIDIPEDKLQAVLTFQKNSDSTLPASHVMKLRFVTQPGGAMGNVNRINVPYMRREDAQTGDPLNGVPVPIMENSFLVGLAKGPAEATNLDLVRTREWVDVPMVFANGKIAKLTFEKGTSGQRAIEDALAAWKGQ
jgi:hypothetical protein